LSVTHAPTGLQLFSAEALDTALLIARDVYEAAKEAAIDITVADVTRLRSQEWQNAIVRRVAAQGRLEVQLPQGDPAMRSCSRRWRRRYGSTARAIRPVATKAPGWVPAQVPDKAKALASYAKQANDETLHRYADRIKARAIRRCGQLVKQIEPKHTGRPKNGRGTSPNSRLAAAKAAGLFNHQICAPSRKLTC
jgi:hypothetical protein